MNPEQKKGVTISTIFLVLLSFLVGISCVHLVSGQSQWEQLFGPSLPVISINDNGIISPTDFPIVRSGNQYYLTGDIYNHAIIVYCDNIVLDGRDFTLKSNGSLNGGAIGIFARNVTVKNFVLDTFPWGIYLYGDYGASGVIGERTEISILNNTISNCGIAIHCWGPSANSFRENVLENNTVALEIKGEAYSNGESFSRGYACFNSVERNIIKYNDEGVHLEDANQSIIRLNLIAQNGYGAFLNDVEGTNFAANEFKSNIYGIHIIAPSSSNQFLKNNFDGNSEAVTVEGQNQSKNSWDDGSMGNYWSNFNGTGIYKIDDNNIDHYPLSQPVDINSVASPKTDSSTQNPIQTQTFIAIVIIVTMVAAFASVLFFRRHQKTVKNF
jgi:parallel beta-helix repeat protein